MALKIRLRQQGRRNQLVYRLVLADSRSPRDGKYLENLGWYNPVAKDENENLMIHADRVAHWLEQGAVLTEKAESLVKRGAPAVMETYRQKVLAKKAKQCASKKKDKSA